MYDSHGVARCDARGNAFQSIGNPTRMDGGARVMDAGVTYYRR